MIAPPEIRQAKAVLAREPVPATPRRGMTVSRALRVLHGHDWACSGCGNSVREDPCEIDHVIPLALGGSDTDDHNLQPLCVPCHKAKTRADLRAIAKVRRLIKRALGQRRTRRPIIGRPFDKRLRRKFSGVVEVRG